MGLPRNFIYLWISQIFCQTAIAITSLVLALLIYSQTKSNLAVSFLFIAYGLPAFLFSIPSGVIVDRLDKKKTLTWVNVLRAVFCIAFLLLPKTYLSLTLIFAFSMSLLTQLFFPAEGAVIPDIVKKEQLLKANSLYSSTFFVTQFLGYFLAGPLLKLMPNYAVFILLAGLFFASAVFTHLISYPFRGSKNGLLKGIRGDFMQGMVYLKKEKVILNALVVLAISQIVTGVFISLMPGLAVEVLGIDPRDVSFYLMGPAVLGMFLGVIVLNRFFKHKRKLTLVKMGFAGTALCLIALSFIKRVPFEIVKEGINLVRFKLVRDFLQMEYARFLGVDLLVFAVFLMLLIGAFGSLIIVSLNTLIQERAQKEQRGKIYGILQALVNLSGFIPLVLGGILADKIGIPRVIGLMGILLGMGFFVLRKKSKNLLPTAP